MLPSLSFLRVLGRDILAFLRFFWGWFGKPFHFFSFPGDPALPHAPHKTALDGCYFFCLTHLHCLCLVVYVDLFPVLWKSSRNLNTPSAFQPGFPNYPRNTSVDLAFKLQISINSSWLWVLISGYIVTYLLLEDLVLFFFFNPYHTFTLRLSANKFLPY